jgi:hypothetical protein
MVAKRNVTWYATIVIETSRQGVERWGISFEIMIASCSVCLLQLGTHLRALDKGPVVAKLEVLAPFRIFHCTTDFRMEPGLDLFEQEHYRP